MNKEKIKEKFIIKAAEHGLAYSNGDYKKANKLHKKLHELYDLVKAHDQIYLFKDMLKNEDENVRLWAAIFSLKYDHIEAEKILKQLAENSNIKMTAKTTLHLWKEGKLNLL